MGIREAAESVLKEARKPLHVREITQLALQRGLWKTSGKTPEATVGATLYTDINKRKEESPFVLKSPQTFGLRDYGEELPPPAAHYSFTDAAEKVLEQQGDKQPMHYRAITEKAIELGWLNTEGKTPEATMYAQVLTEIGRRQDRGQSPRFVKHGKGYVGLAGRMPTGLPRQILQHNNRIRRDLHQKLLSMEPGRFEECVSQLLAEMRFEDLVVTRSRGDGGIDVRGTLVIGQAIRIHMAIQAKRWKLGRNVGAPIVREVRGSLKGYEQGLIVTTSGFSSGARVEAARQDATPVGLMDGEQFTSLLMEHQIGVTRQAHDLFELEEL